MSVEGGKTIRQLKKEAMVLKIKGYYNMRKSELVRAISERKMELAKAARNIESMKIHELRTFAKKINLKLKRNYTKKDLIRMISDILSTWTSSKRTEEKPLGISSVSSKKKIEKKAPEISKNLPESYGKDKLVGLEVNPNWIHFYWDFSTQTQQIIASHAPIVLRIYDVTYLNFNGVNAHRTFELELEPSTRKYYVNVPNAGANYIAEIGYKDGEKFVPLIRSNLISTPPSSPRISQMEVWKDLKSGQKFVEISAVAKRHVEKLKGVSSLSISKITSGGGSFIWANERKSES